MQIWRFAGNLYESPVSIRKSITRFRKTARRLRVFVPEPLKPVTKGCNETDMAAQVHRYRAGLHMNTNVISPLAMHNVEDYPAGLGTRESLSISATRSVRADRQRILRALTLPEYMETWLSVPAVRPGCTSVSLLEDSFLISCFCTERSKLHILCNYKVCRRGKVVFTWSRGNGIAPGLVTIRLLGDFERTTVQVTHSGLHHSEAEWYQELWENSLEKLSNLF